MAIFIVNNYYKPENRNKIDRIIEALEECGETNYILLDFTRISECKITDEINAVILSGSSAQLGNPEHLSMYEEEIKFIHRVGVPLLGICFGHQLIGKAFDSEIKSLPKFIKDLKEVEILEPDEIFSSWKRGEKITVCQSHQDYVASLPSDFTCLARSESCQIEAMKHNFKPIYGVQAHIERVSDKHPDGRQILKNFLENVVKRKNRMCNQIFTKFQWEDLVSISPEKLPENAGVYVIRVRKRGKPVSEVISHAENFLKKIKWPPFSGYVLNRVNRLKKIRKCPIIYIGAAPTSLRGRYKDLCGRRHTAFFPILALLMTGWELDFGWLQTDKSEEIEKSLKRQYTQIHGALPALVRR